MVAVGVDAPAPDHADVTHAIPAAEQTLYSDDALEFIPALTGSRLFK